MRPGLCFTKNLQKYGEVNQGLFRDFYEGYPAQEPRPVAQGSRGAPVGRPSRHYRVSCEPARVGRPGP